MQIADHYTLCQMWTDFYHAALNALQGSLVARKVYVRPSVKRVDYYKMEEKSVQIFIAYEISFSLVFCEKECLVGATLLPQILGQLARVGAKLLIFNQYSLVAPEP